MNRSTYYKHFYSALSNRAKENQKISNLILKIIRDSEERIGNTKIRNVLESEYGIKISEGRLYRLLDFLEVITKNTKKPFIKYGKSDKNDDNFPNLINGDFNPEEPNKIW